MDPKVLLPVLALVFGGLAGWHFWRHGKGHLAARTWAVIAVLFAAVSCWLHRAA